MHQSFIAGDKKSMQDIVTFSGQSFANLRSNNTLQGRVDNEDILKVAEEI